MKICAFLPRLLTRTHLTYNNDKPWFTAKLRPLCQAKEDAYRKGDEILYKQAKYTLEKENRVSKMSYSDKLRIQFSSSDSASVWKDLKEITTTRHCKKGPGWNDPMTAVVPRVKGFACYDLSFSRHNKNIKMEHFFLYILSRYFI